MGILPGIRGGEILNPDLVSSPLTTYFREIDAGRFEAVLATLSDSCVYIRPAAQSAGGGRSATLETLIGKDAVRTFLDKRGKLPLEHDILSAVTDDRQCFVQGTATLVAPPHSHQSIFMAHALLNSEGLIARFLAISTDLDEAAASWFSPSAPVG